MVNRTLHAGQVSAGPGQHVESATFDGPLAVRSASPLALTAKERRG